MTATRKSNDLPTGFELLDHPADMGFRAWAPSLPELLVVSAKTLTSVLVDVETIGAEVENEITISAEELDMLMYNWLSEFLFLFDAEGLLFREFEIIDFMTTGAGSNLTARLRGEQFSKERHQVKTYVKAITLHQLKVEQNAGRYEAQIYLDI